MLLKSSITQVSHTSSAITPDTAATRPAMRSTSSIRLISFTGGSVQISTMNGSAAIKGSVTVLLGLALFSVALPMPMAEAAQGAECPEQVRFQIDALYRWQLERQQQSGPIQISSQRQRFTPQLYRLLQRAYDLTPADGRFVDFDLFSGSQVNTFSATFQGCRQEQVYLFQRAWLCRRGWSVAGLSCRCSCTTCFANRPGMVGVSPTSSTPMHHRFA